jgi:uncharacterized membrane protein (UPF0127 family)
MTLNNPSLMTLALLLLINCLPAGCKPKPAAAPAEGRADAAATVPMRIGSETFHLEVADTDDERRRGLMYRESMPADHGMIFVFPEEEEQSFWMKNTLIPLDIIYLDEWGKVVSIKPMKPRDLTGVDSDGPAMYAVEVNRGAAARAGVKAGDRLTIPKEIEPATE